LLNDFLGIAALSKLHEIEHCQAALPNPAESMLRVPVRGHVRTT
jgi:hypothetical protein